jgi:hypothetical protein
VNFNTPLATPTCRVKKSGVARFLGFPQKT